MTARRALAALTAALVLAGVARAEVAWSDLSAAQQAALAPLRTQWHTIDDERRAKWLEVAARFSSLPPAERARVQERMAQWSRLTPAERGQTRLQFQQAQRWTAQERQERWEAYQSLAPEAREVLAERWKLEARAARSGTTTPAGKRNVFEAPPPPAAPARAASPTTIRAPAGATTQPMLRPGTEPLHHQSGVPKIAATEAFVDPATLLPRRGPQGAAVVAPAPAKTRP